MRLPAQRAVSLFMWVLLVSGCPGGARPGPWAGSLVDSAGVSIVTNPAEGLWADTEVWSLHEELRIGAFGGDPNYQFAQVGSIAVNSAGEILVMDRQVREIRVFTQAGEFGIGATDVFVVDGDTVLVPDVRNRRVHRFDPNGGLVSSTLIDVARHRPLRFKWSAVARRSAVQLRPTNVMLDDGGDAIDELRLLDEHGKIGDLLLSVPSGALLGPNVVRYFTPEPAWALTDSLSVLYAVNSEYRIGVYARDGALLRIISKPHEPRPITDRDKRAFFTYLDRAWLAAGVPPSRLEANHRRVTFAEVFPAFSVFHVGYQGSLWVQPVRAPGDLTDAEIERYNFLEDFGASEWDVFDRTGRFLGQVEMPPRFQPRLFLNDAIYGVARDEFDVQYVVRLRIGGGRAGRDSA